MDEIESRAMPLLARWLRDRDLRGGESIRWIADRLVTRVAVDERDVLLTEERGREAMEATAPPAPSTAPSGEEHVMGAELRAAMLSAMAEMTPRSQQVLRAFEAAQQGGPELAAALSLSAEAARQALSRARLEMLECLVSAGIELPEALTVRKG